MKDALYLQSVIDRINSQWAQMTPCQRSARLAALDQRCAQIADAQTEWAVRALVQLTLEARA